MTNNIVLVYPDYRQSKVFQHTGLPVGLGYIAESLKQEGIKYEFVDLNLDSIEDLHLKINEFRPQFLGISMMSYRCERTYKLLSEIKKKWHELIIVAGGPHLTTNKEKVLLECLAIDIGVVGEGEITLIEVMRDCEISSIRGVIYRTQGNVYFVGDREFISNLDNIPFPKYEGFKLEKYGSMMTLNSSRGCPYRCIFCAAPRILGRKWRNRSANGMITEFMYWYRQGYRDFAFSDSNFGVQKQRVLDFCDEILSTKFNVRFHADGLRADHFDRFMLEKMKIAGFIGLTFGVESGSDAVLKNLKKGETISQIESTISNAIALDFRVTLFFLIGSPGEREADIRKSFELAIKYNIIKVYFFNLTPIMGTEFYDWALSKKFINLSGVRYPEDNFGFSEEAIMSTDAMSQVNLTKWIRIARRLELLIDWRYRFLAMVTKICKVIPGAPDIIQGYPHRWIWFVTYPIIFPVSRLAWHGLSKCRHIISKSRELS